MGKSDILQVGQKVLDRSLRLILGVGEPMRSEVSIPEDHEHFGLLELGLGRVGKGPARPASPGKDLNRIPSSEAIQRDSGSANEGDHFRTDGTSDGHMPAGRRRRFFIKGDGFLYLRLRILGMGEGSGRPALGVAREAKDQSSAGEESDDRRG